MLYDNAKRICLMKILDEKARLECSIKMPYVNTGYILDIYWWKFLMKVYYFDENTRWKCQMNMLEDNSLWKLLMKNLGENAQWKWLMKMVSQSCLS